ncbi:MAG: 2-oxo acid dehydrogenase subunit E2 [Armatimonadetes bacterium]|nr:2-oxo acid dehydrogenase subunit E2 [Armatimonadota bacterium]
MPVEILMPELGESVHEGTVSRWLKKVGEFVREDEPIVEIMTDKVNTELPSPATGVLKEILIPEGSPVAVFAALGVIEEAEGATAAVEPAAPAEPKAEQAPAQAAAEAPREKTFLTPLVRAMAKRHGISEAELAVIPGTGQGGRVTKADLEAYLESRGKSAPPPAPAAQASPAVEAKAQKPAAAAPSAETVESLTGLRRMIAEAMVRSAQVPTVSTVTEVDVTRMVQFRERNKDAFQAEHGVKLTYTPFFLKALTEALLEFPLLNSSLSADFQLSRHANVNIGVAVALGARGDEGLIVPVIRECEKKTLVELAKEVDRLARKARSNALSLEDVQGGTFTLTNPGTYGALFGTPMINAPQAGILGTYAIRKMPVVIEDMIAIRSVMNLVLTYDHRLVDGLLAGRFLAAVREKLEKFDFFR